MGMDGQVLRGFTGRRKVGSTLRLVMSHMGKVRMEGKTSAKQSASGLGMELEHL